MLMLFHLRIFVPCSAILHTNLFSPWVTAKLSQLASFRKKASCEQQDHFLLVLSRLERSAMIQNKFVSLPQLLPHRYLCPYICHNIHQDRLHTFSILQQGTCWRLHYHSFIILDTENLQAHKVNRGTKEQRAMQTKAQAVSTLLLHSRGCELLVLNSLEMNHFTVLFQDLWSSSDGQAQFGDVPLSTKISLLS